MGGELLSEPGFQLLDKTPNGRDTLLGQEELFLPQESVTTVWCLIKKLEARFGEEFSSHREGLVCLYDSVKGPRALDLNEDLLPGSTILFLGIVESG